MPDIFISYSRKDSEQAELLAELLGSAGLSCWIDKAGIDLATSWSGEITKAINDCKAFVVLLSPSSVSSINVSKEISLASERKKKILPLDLEPVTLPDDLAYHLAGLQRASMTNIDAIIRALGKLGLEATGAPQSPKIVKETDARKSLMILPFEDMSPTGDNGWFADGIASELITALSSVKALRVSDQQATKDYKRYQGTLPTYAKEMGVRYFIQGDVRKFGDSIKITSRLLDIETGDHLWQDSMKGTMNDIFDIQEKVAIKVVEGLKIHLTKEETSKLEVWGTENAEAYEYLMRAWQLNYLDTREEYLQAISLLDLALKLDPLFVNAMIEKAQAIISLFKSYQRDPTFLGQAELLLQRVEEMEPGRWRTHDQLASLYLAEGRAEEAEREHQAHITNDDGSAISQAQLGYFCFNTKQYSKAYEYYDAALKIDTAIYVHLWNVIINARYSDNSEGINRWSDIAIFTFQKQLRLHPDYAYPRYFLAATYFWSNPPRLDESLREINLLESLPDLDSMIQYRVANLLAEQRKDDQAIESLRKAFRKGFSDVGKVREADSPFAPLFGHPGFEAVMQDAEAKSNA